MTRQGLGERISQARREKGVREQRDVLKSEMAEAAGVDASTITAWEQGRKTPREGALELLAAFLGVTPAYLRYGIIETQTQIPAVIPAGATSLHSYTEEERQADAIQAEKDRAALAAQAARRRKRKAGGRK